MADESNLVIKINYQKKDKKKKISSEPGMVTEWHWQRILIALILLVIFIILPFFFLDNDESLPNLEDTGKVTVTVIESINSVPLIVKKPLVKKPENNDVKLTSNNNIKQIDNSISVLSKKVDKTVSKDQTDVLILTDKRIVRAQLTSGVKNKEPKGNISLPITVSENAAAGVFYFTEIINMKGQYLYHRWTWKDQVIYKRKINIMGNRWRATTSKLIPFSKTGKWIVSLVDNNDVILNKIQFEVIKE